MCHWVIDWLKEDGTLGATELRKKLKDEFGIWVPYMRVYKGKNLDMDKLYGPWDKSFNNLFRLKAQLEKSSPGSIFVIDHHTIGNKIRFNRLFFALKPCVDGFLRGCRPYLAIDSTFLTGRFRGQLCIACAVDGSTDCGQAVMHGVSEVFPGCEHRECMYHLVQNFKKRYSGKIFDDHLWQAAYSWSPYMFNKHYQAMAAAKPEARESQEKVDKEPVLH